VSGHGGATVRLYAGVFLALLALTGVTLWAAYLDIGAWHTPVALLIASVKGLLVLLYFMHVRWASRLTWVVAAAGFVFLLILLAFTLADYLSRGWLFAGDPPG
jgi:cytochrome c oxidase subunit IV